MENREVREIYVDRCMPGFWDSGRCIWLTFASRQSLQALRAETWLTVYRAQTGGLAAFEEKWLVEMVLSKSNILLGPAV